MIDFRYHIVSIVAVFLALGIGVAIGSTVVERVSVVSVQHQLTNLRKDLDRRRSDITELRTELARRERLAKALSARVAGRVLAEREVLFVNQADGAPWVRDARDAVLHAGAKNMGTLEFTDRWGRRVAPNELEQIYAQAAADLPETKTAESFIRVLGEHVTDATGRTLVDALAKGGYMRSGAADPFTGAAGVAVFTAGGEDTPEVKRMAAFSQGAGSVLPTVVVAGSADDVGAIGPLRAVGTEQQLATFDSALVDDTGVGTVLAFVAATESRGGHFGRGSGLTYLPPA